MSLIVMKFGGTSVGDATRIRASAEIACKAKGKHQVAVVVSALSGVTDLILKTVSAARQGEDKQVAEQMQLLQERHKKVIGELFKGPERKGIEEQVGTVLKQLHDICAALLLAAINYSTNHGCGGADGRANVGAHLCGSAAWDGGGGRVRGFDARPDHRRQIRRCICRYGRDEPKRRMRF